ncbi:hypothetical protein ES703_112467 [subsurface metagenome]
MVFIIHYLIGAPLSDTTVHEKRRKRKVTKSKFDCRGLKYVYPRIKYTVAIGVSRVKPIVGFKIVHDKEVGCCKAPDTAFTQTVGVSFVDLIDSPVVSDVPIKLSRLIGG